MPHLTLEYTGNLRPAASFDELFAQLHQVLAEVGGISPDNCKSRAIRLDDYFVGGGGARQAFVHLTIRFLAGRPTELKQQIGRRSLSVLQQHFPPSTDLDLQLTVEIQEIERATYCKFPEGTL
jgi:5-carboxymethyl-2-hydroxymuconate isomerase